MKTKVVPLCESCGREIINESEGVIVQGNIFPLDPKKDPIVGGAFAEIPDHLPFNHGNGVDGEGNPLGDSTASILDKIEQFAFHAQCLVSKLGGRAAGRPAPTPGGSFPDPAGPAPTPGLVDLPGTPTQGDSVRLLEDHPDYARFSTKVFSVGRIRQEEGDFVLYAPDGTPVLAGKNHVVRVQASG